MLWWHFRGSMEAAWSQIVVMSWSTSRPLIVSTWLSMHNHAPSAWYWIMQCMAGTDRSYSLSQLSLATRERYDNSFTCTLGMYIHRHSHVCRREETVEEATITPHLSETRMLIRHSLYFILRLLFTAQKETHSVGVFWILSFEVPQTLQHSID